MLESHLGEGRQTLTADPRQLRYRVSITDGCIGWEETADLIEGAYDALEKAAEIGRSERSNIIGL